MSFLASKRGVRSAEVQLGLIFFVFGLNFFLHFLPAPSGMPERAQTFMGGLIASGYLMPLVKSLEVVAGLALLTSSFVPLALLVLAPIIVNIVAFHTLIMPAYPLTFTVLGLQLYLAYSYRAAYAHLLRARWSVADGRPIQSIVPPAPLEPAAVRVRGR